MIVNGKRALAHIEKVTNIRPIEGADNIEQCYVLGWNLICKKGEFKEGDPCVYIEIDSKVPEREEFEFLRTKGFKVKTMKLGKFNCISQGLALPQSVFKELDGLREGTDVTDILGIKYSVEEDNIRKSNGNPNAKYKSMKARHPKFFSNKFVKKLMKYEWFRKLIFVFLEKKKDAPKGFPKHFPFIKVTDEERCENLPYILENKEPWIKTQKVDGTSSTYILEKKGRKYEQYVCSRNVRQLTPSQANYHKDIDGNVYWMMAEKYHIFDFLKKYLERNHLSYVCIQGETAGPNIQGNPHKLKEICFFGYNLIRSDIGRINSIDAAKICNRNGIPWVPIADEHYILPDTMEELKKDADGSCLVGEGLREGWVYRSLDGQRSFKNVSREYLLKRKE